MRFRKGWVAGFVLSTAVVSVTVCVVASKRRRKDVVFPEPVSPPVLSAAITSVIATQEPAVRDVSRKPSCRGRRIAGSVLALLILAGAVHNTSSNFTAQTRNPGNGFSNGTLVLTNTKSGSTTCLSTGGGTTNGNVNNACDTLINVSVRAPGDATTGRLTLRNNGSLNASALQFALLNCVTANAPGEAFNGTGNLCTTIRVYVQEFSDSGFTTKSNCRYGGGTATVCDYSDAAKTLSALQAATVTPLGLGAQNASASRYFEIGIQLPGSAGNDMQGRAATFDLAWTLQQ